MHLNQVIPSYHTTQYRWILEANRLLNTQSSITIYITATSQLHRPLPVAIIQRRIPLTHRCLRTMRGDKKQQSLQAAVVWSVIQWRRASLSLLHYAHLLRSRSRPHSTSCSLPWIKALFDGVAFHFDLLLSSCQWECSLSLAFSLSFILHRNWGIGKRL